jgi:quercetin dioxygenase-like cupin family protein
MQPRAPRHPGRAAILAAAALTAATAARAEPSGPAEDFVTVRPDAVAFREGGSSGLAVAVLAGDPSAPGLYVLRVRFPPGVQSAPHFHDQDRHVTVLEGTWAFGTDASGDCARTEPLPAGSFAIHPAGAVHFDGACGDTATVVEITGLGPVTTTPVPRTP